MVAVEAEDTPEGVEPFEDSVRYCVDEADLRDLHERELLLTGQADTLIDIITTLQDGE